MLNKKSSSGSNLSKMSLIFPMLLAFMLTFNVKTEAQIKQKTKVVLNDVQFYQDELASALITKNSTEEELEDFSRKFKKHGVELQFKGLKYSKEGLFTGIKIKFKIDKNGESGTYNKSGDTPIDPFEITLSEDFKIEFSSPNGNSENHEFVFLNEATNGVLDTINTHNAVILEKELSEMSRDSTIVVNPNSNKYKKSFAVVSNVQFISSEPDSNTGKRQIMNDRSKLENRITWTEKDSTSSKNNYRVIVLDSSRSNARSVSKRVKVIANGNNAKPLYIINGEIETDDSKASIINPDNIENVYIIKDASKIKKYGAKGKNGVVKINTKNNKLFRIKATTTDAELEDLKRTVAATTDFQLSLNSLERNKKGLISKINIKFNGDSGKMVSGNYSELDGIPDIYVGQKKDGGVIIYSY